MARPVKDSSKQHPIGNVWRPMFRAIVEAFRAQDFHLSRGVPSVKPIAPRTAKQIEEYLDDYGETLDALPEEAWETSVAQWMEGHWDVVVDLWTVESGESDLALSARVFEDGDGYRIEVVGVYVP